MPLIWFDISLETFVLSCICSTVFLMILQIWWSRKNLPEPQHIFLTYGPAVLSSGMVLVMLILAIPSSSSINCITLALSFCVQHCCLLTVLVQSRPDKKEVSTGRKSLQSPSGKSWLTNGNDPWTSMFPQPSVSQPVSRDISNTSEPWSTRFAFSNVSPVDSPGHQILQRYPSTTM